MTNIELMNTKKVFSTYSNELITFVESLDSIAEGTKGVFSNGMTLLDNIADAEDDIQHMYFVLKDGTIENCEDFYSEHGAFEENSNFIEDIKNLVADR